MIFDCCFLFRPRFPFKGESVTLFCELSRGVLADCSMFGANLLAVFSPIREKGVKYAGASFVMAGAEGVKYKGESFAAEPAGEGVKHAGELFEANPELLVYMTCCVRFKKSR